jgi:hypothetical protein
MRRCKCCGELTVHDEPSCCHCAYLDAGWGETLRTNGRRSVRNTRSTHSSQQLALHPSGATADWEPVHYAVNLSAFSDSGELGFHLKLIKALLAAEHERDIIITLNGSGLGYEWDYAYDFDPARDFYLPPSLPLPSLIEVARFARILTQIGEQNSNLRVVVVLPPEKHAATQLIAKAGIIPNIAAFQIGYAEYPSAPSNEPGCDDVLVPLTAVDASSYGQLAQGFHSAFDKLVKAGRVEEQHRSALRMIVMEAAENADSWGGGRGWAACFLRQETRGTGRWGAKERSFTPARDSHLFIHVFSIGPTLAESTGHTTEWEAAVAISVGQSARPTGGGTGMPNILQTVTERALGTVFLNSGNYIRIVSPDGIVREHVSRGSAYLPGVHLCALVPLAVVSGILRPDAAQRF